MCPARFVYSSSVVSPSVRWRFSARVEHKGDTAILFVEGRVGYQALRDFLAAARRCLTLPGVRLLILDLAGLDYLNGGGLRGIIELGAQARTAGARVVVRGAADAVRVTLGLADFRRRRSGKGS